MLQVKNISFSYPRKEVFSQVNFAMAEGETVSLLGASGGGKTTFFKLLAGVLQPQEGQILWKGSADFSLVTYMMQQDLLLPWKTVYENALMLAQLAGKSPSACMIHTLLEQVGLHNVSHSYPHELSEGMKQRVSLVRALLVERPVLLLDEPFASIDSVQKQLLYALLQERQKERNLTVLFITHDVAEAKALSQTTYELQEGQLCRV